MPLPKPDDLVVIQRTVVVSKQQTLQELADATGQDIKDVIRAFSKRRTGEAWVQENHVADMVPYFDRASEADGDTLDQDIWTARLGNGHG